MSRQDGGGVVYPARTDELVRWSAVATVASGVAYWSVSRANGSKRPLTAERAVCAFGIVYGLAIVFLTTIASLDAGVTGFEPARVALHLAAMCVVVVVAVARARKGGATKTHGTYAGALYLASLFAVALV